MANVYKDCPVFSDEKFLLRLISKEDCADLLKVYSDARAVPLFNSDNCHGDDFYYQTMERMEQAVDFWIDAYNNGWFVRWVVVDQSRGEAIGTIELFKRASDDAFNGYGVLRLDLRSDYENAADIGRVLQLIIPPSYALFGVERVITKAAAMAAARREALAKEGFTLSAAQLIGSDGTTYGDYLMRPKER